MKSIIVSVAAIAGLMMAGTVLAGSMPAEGAAKCGACHAADQKGVGPSYADIAKKYKGDGDAANKLAANIAKGGAFGWNMGQMPAKGMGASDAEVKAMADYIAGLAK